MLVYRYRVKSLNGLLNRQSRAVNYVWNFCNDTQKHALKWGKKWPRGFARMAIDCRHSVPRCGQVQVPLVAGKRENAEHLGEPLGLLFDVACGFRMHLNERRVHLRHLI
ncbi:hypothetical protein B0G57_103242 [Trinickia symbiotica]|nr:hypothetical protein B0G57_103242 [Trinickia symbiotica]